MEDISEKLNQLLADPAALSKIMALAGSLGDGAPPCETAGEPGFPGFDEQTLQKLFGVLSEANRSGGREEALFHALKPFVSEKRCAKMDKAAQIARISRIAGCALRSFGK